MPMQGGTYRDVYGVECNVCVCVCLFVYVFVCFVSQVRVAGQMTSVGCTSS